MTLNQYAVITYKHIAYKHIASKYITSKYMPTKIEWDTLMSMVSKGHSSGDSVDATIQSIDKYMTEQYMNERVD